MNLDWQRNVDRNPEMLRRTVTMGPGSFFVRGPNPTCSTRSEDNDETVSDIQSMIPEENDVVVEAHLAPNAADVEVRVLKRIESEILHNVSKSV